MSFFPALSGSLALLNSASSFLSMIPGLGTLVSGLNSVMNLINDIQISFGPIMQTSKNIAQYVRMTAEGKKTIDSLLSARDLNDAAALLNNFTQLAGSTMPPITGSTLKSNLSAVTDQTMRELDAEIRKTQAAYERTTDQALRAAIRQRLNMLVANRRSANHTTNGIRAMQNNQKVSTRSMGIPGQQAQVSAGMMSAAAGATSATATGKLTVAAVTEQTSAVTNSLANLSQQFTEMAGLQVATNDSLDQMVQGQVASSAAEAAAAAIADQEEQRQIQSNYSRGMNDADVAKAVIDQNLDASSVKSFDAADVLFR
ncbi:hypothetical protein [Deinococcus multiflagellatus]|uniref:Uncharacterized protein n=2 Tax=Deinococcus multiflagellatus TaxID=1656887 RepID=A0ABW1ZRM8_9DEIO